MLLYMLDSVQGSAYFPSNGFQTIPLPRKNWRLLYRSLRQERGKSSFKTKRWRKEWSSWMHDQVPQKMIGEGPNKIQGRGIWQIYHNLFCRSKLLPWNTLLTFHKDGTSIEHQWTCSRNLRCGNEHGCFSYYHQVLAILDLLFSPSLRSFQRCQRLSFAYCW